MTNLEISFSITFFRFLSIFRLGTRQDPKDLLAVLVLLFEGREDEALVPSLPLCLFLSNK